MSPRRRYSLKKIRVVKDGEQQSAWPLMREAVTGTEHRYSVTDENSSVRNKWVFTVRVPTDRTRYIEVRPADHPNLKAWAELQDRSLLFARATRSGYSGWCYCQLTLADPTGEKTRRKVPRGGRQQLRWLGIPSWRYRLKATVRPTRGYDGDGQVLIVRADDHATMIRLFFATKVWILKESFSLAD
jgi:hypothetical protein